MKSKQNRRSLQEIRELRQRETFVGREKQEELYLRNFTLKEEQRIYLFNIFGIGGVGKSSLLNRFQQIAKSSGAITAWNDETQKDILAVMENIVKQFEKQNHEFKKFSKLYQAYLQKCHELVTDPNAPSGLADFIGSLTKVGIRLGQTTPANLLLGYVDADTLSKEVENLTGNLISHLRRKLSDEDTRLIQNPIDELTPLFIEDLWDISQDQFITIFFDTFEYTGEYLEEWLIKCLDAHYGTIPTNFILAIAGQKELDKNKWKAHEGILYRISLNPFTDEEALKFLSLRGITDEEIIRVILDLSKGLPLLVATLATERPNDLSQLGDINSTAIDCFLKWVKDPIRRQILLDAALALVVNKDILEVLIGKEEATASFDWFKQMPFIKKTSNGWVYHDVVRPHLLHLKHVETPQEWSNLHVRLASFYKEAQNKLQLADEKKMIDAMWQEFARQEIYHLLCQSPQNHLLLALDRFIIALAFTSSAHQWAEIIQQAGEDSEDKTVKYWGTLLTTGLNDREEKPCEKFILMLSELLNHHELDSNLRVFLIQFRFAAYFESGQKEQALIDCEELLFLRPNYAIYWFLKCIILMGFGRKKEWLETLEQLDKVDPTFMPNLIKQIVAAYKRSGVKNKFMEELESSLERTEEIRSNIDKHNVLNPQNNNLEVGGRAEQLITPVFRIKNVELIEKAQSNIEKPEI